MSRPFCRVLASCPRCIRALVLAMLVLLPGASALAQVGQVRISQIFASGGTNASLPRADYVELFNSGDTPVALDGWTLQTAAATGTAWTSINLSGTIGPKKYYLVQVGANIATGIAITPDAGPGAATFDILGNGGKVALLSSTALLTGNPGCPFPSAVVDFVGWGNANQRFPCNTGLNAVSFSGSNALYRLCGGKRDSGSNISMFQSAAAAPRNSASPANASIDIALTAPSPAAVSPGQQIVITVNATTSSCAGQVSSVRGDLSSLGGPATLAFTRVGTTTEYQATVDLNTLGLTPGVYTFPIRASATLISEVATVLQVINVRPPNDDCGSPTTVQIFGSGAGPFTVNNDAAQTEPFPAGCADGDTSSRGVWYRVELPGPGQLRVRETSDQDAAIAVHSGSCGALSTLACSSADDLAVRTAEPVVTVQIVRDASTPAIQPPLTVSFDFLPAPDMDTCAAARVIALSAGDTVGPPPIETDGALDDTVPAQCSTGGIANRGVWFRAALPQAGRLVVAEVSTQETSVAIFTGACNALVFRTCGSAPQTEYTGSAGEIVYVLFWRTNGAVSDAAPLEPRFTFLPDALPPLNDFCSSPIEVPLGSGVIGPFQVNNNSASADVDIGDCTPSTIGDNGIWFRVTLPASVPQGGSVRVFESGGQDVAIARLEGVCGSGLTVLNCSAADELSFSALGGQSFFILIVRDPANQAAPPPVSVSFEFTPSVVAPSNDTCNGATPVDLTSASTVGPITQSNADATPDADPGACTPSVIGDNGVWFRVQTPNLPGTLTISEASAQTVAIAVSSGACAAPTSIACSADEQLSVGTSAGQSLLVLVVRDPASQPSAPDLSLTFSFVPSIVAPPNDLPCNATPLSLGITQAGSTIGATAGGDGPVVACSPSPIGGGAGVWYVFTPAATGAFTISTCTSATDTDLTVFTLSGCAGSGSVPSFSPLAGGCDGASCGSGSSSARLGSVTLQGGAAYHIRVSNPVGASPGEHTIRVDAVAGGACCDPASGACFPSMVGSCASGLTFQGPGTACEPNACPPGANDECTTPAPITLGVAISATNAAANTSSALSTSGCVTPASTTDGRDVFFRFVPTVSTIYEITLCGSRFDTTLGIHTGCPATAVNRVACNDNALPACSPAEPSSSRIAAIQLLAGTPYLIRVAGSQGATGQFTLLVNAAGVCCRGTTCSTTLVTAGACLSSLPPNSGAGAEFISIASGCNASPAATTPCCFADVNKAGGVSLDDLFIYLNIWFQGSIYADISGNGAGAPNLDDLFAYLNVWFAGC